jgi:triosephosphate isomerase
MHKPFSLRPPFFEFGPKAYLYGAEMLRLAEAIDRAAVALDVDVVLTPQPMDIPLLAPRMKRVMIFAQHMDPLKPGRGLGAILPEAVRAAGAVGVMLNHAERPLDRETLAATVRRADETGLATMVCADTVEDIRDIAGMAPNVIVAEPTALIGTGQTSDDAYVTETLRMVRAVNPGIMVLQGAGISNAGDVYRVMKLGAEGTGSTSGILKAPDPARMAFEMLSALRRAWDELHPEPNPARN